MAVIRIVLTTLLSELDFEDTDSSKDEANGHHEVIMIESDKESYYIPCSENEGYASGLVSSVEEYVSRL